MPELIVNVGRGELDGEDVRVKTTRRKGGGRGKKLPEEASIKENKGKPVGGVGVGVCPVPE